jgi:hypothetical protein
MMPIVERALPFRLFIQPFEPAPKPIRHRPYAAARGLLGPGSDATSVTTRLRPVSLAL